MIKVVLIQLTFLTVCSEQKVKINAKNIMTSSYYSKSRSTQNKQVTVWFMGFSMTSPYLDKFNFFLITLITHLSVFVLHVLNKRNTKILRYNPNITTKCYFIVLSQVNEISLTVNQFH